MANWITNHLQIRASSETIAKIKSELSTDENLIMDFNTLVKMPFPVAATPALYEQWSSVNWGTSCNAMECSEADDTISFLTPNRSPLILMEHLAQKYPNVEFRFRFADEDLGNNFGEILFMGAEQFEISYRPEAYSDEAIVLALMYTQNAEWTDEEKQAELIALNTPFVQ